MQHFELNTYVAKHEHFFKSTVYNNEIIIGRQSIQTTILQLQLFQVFAHHISRVVNVICISNTYPETHAWYRSEVSINKL